MALWEEASVPAQHGLRPEHVPFGRLLFAAGTALAISFIIATDGRATSVEPYLFAAAIGACLLVPPRSRASVLVLTIVLVFVYYIRDNPPIGAAVPVAAALFAATRAGLLTMASFAASGVLLASIWFRWREGEGLGFLVGYEGVTNAALMAATILLGDSVRTRRLAADQAETIRTLEAEQLHTAATIRLENERVAVARDLHDIVGHALSVISIQTAVASERLPHDHAAHSAVALARTTAVESMNELRSLLKQLRTDGDRAEAGLVSLSDLEALLDRVRRTGVALNLRFDPRAASLPPAADVTAYRVIQEALTNVTKHAHATRVDITVERSEDRVDIVVADNGVGPGPDAANGHGLVGMAERVRLLEGSLTTTSGRDGKGYRVHVTIPVRGEQ